MTSIEVIHNLKQLKETVTKAHRAGSLFGHDHTAILKILEEALDFWYQALGREAEEKLSK